MRIGIRTRIFCQAVKRIEHQDLTGHINERTAGRLSACICNVAMHSARNVSAKPSRLSCADVPVPRKSVGLATNPGTKKVHSDPVFDKGIYSSNNARTN